MKNTKNNFIRNNFAFIDSQNLNLAIRDQGWKLDFRKFYIYLKDRFHISKAFLFIGYVAGNESLYTSLQRSGYIVIHKPTLALKNGEIKGNVDAELVLHAMIEYDNYEKAVIVSGDGDFHCLIEYLQEKGKLERIIVPNKYKYSKLLKKFYEVGSITFLNNLEEKIGKKKI